ncbi:hydroxymethylglutaryl-CoA synthase [Colletotrichum graminicola]|nr:hydroxymethylglutaryl-CoA synthase [Colletotrichum graminicola]
MAPPANVGIKAIELYFPAQCVDQAELESQDINSIALTAVSGLLRKYNIDPRSIGRLEVGTESMIDKSKSVKSVLMQLFEHCNTNIEGIDTVNACYGGTNALFNAVNWVESRNWDGRDAIVVAGDIALYAEGNARPTGGAGCVAMLVGPGAPLVLEHGRRGSYARHVHDFYKPNFSVEYPYVDGHLSLDCYTEALDACYKAYLERSQTTPSDDPAGEALQTNGVEGHQLGQNLPADKFDYMCFHAPTCKLVAKSYARLFYNDFMSHAEDKLFETVPAELRTASPSSSLNDKTIEKTFMALSQTRFKQRVFPSTHVPTQCGNMYCGSLYSGLCSLLTLVHSDQLQGKRVGMFSYGSGLASTLFSLRVVGSTESMRNKLDLEKRLSARRVVSPATHEEACRIRAFAHQQSPYQPIGSVAGLSKYTYYLTHVDKMFRRTYRIKE